LLSSFYGVFFIVSLAIDENSNSLCLIFFFQVSTASACLLAPKATDLLRIIVPAETETCDWISCPDKLITPLPYAIMHTGQVTCCTCGFFFPFSVSQV
jgi:hypothetical protein